MPASDHTFPVFIENRAGSSTKNTYDESTLKFLGSEKVARAYPYHYGFALNTRGGDGDCVDCFVVTDKVLRAGDVVECAPVRLLEQYEDGEVDHKILCVLSGSAKVVEDDAVAAIRDFVMSVFSHIPGKRMELGSLRDAAEAVRYLRKCSLSSSSRAP